MNQEDAVIPSPSDSAKNSLAEMRRKKKEQFEQSLLEEADEDEAELPHQTTTDKEDSESGLLINGSNDLQHYSPPLLDHDKKEVPQQLDEFDTIVSIPNRVLYDMTRDS